MALSAHVRVSPFSQTCRGSCMILVLQTKKPEPRKITAVSRSRPRSSWMEFYLWFSHSRRNAVGKAPTDQKPPQPHHPWWLYELWPLKCLVSFSSMTGSLNLFSATWKWKVKVAQLCPTLWDPMDYTVHGILQARILEWVVFPFSRGSSQPRDQTQVSHIAGGFFTSWATGEA